MPIHFHEGVGVANAVLENLENQQNLECTSVRERALPIHLCKGEGLATTLPSGRERC